MKINRYLDFNDMFRYKNTIVRNDMEEMLRVNLPWDKLGEVLLGDWGEWNDCHVYGLFANVSREG